MESGTLDTALRQAQKLLAERAYVAAIAQSREIHRHHPGEPRASFIAAVACRYIGEHEAALRLLTPLARAAQASGRVQLEFALAQRATGDSRGSLSTLQRAAETDPEFAALWQPLGELLEEQGDLAGADAALRRHMALSSKHPGLMKAVELTAEGKLGMAEGICRDYLERYPTDVDAIRLLADIGLQLERHEDAATLLRRALELAPDYHVARYQYAGALSKGNRFEAALAELATLERLEPENLAHPVLAASVLVNIGDYDEAISRYERVLQRVPGHARLHMSHGHALKTVGRQADSIAAYRSAIDADPGLGEAYWSLANLKTFRFSTVDIERMRAALDSTAQPLGPREEANLSFALAKALEDEQQYAQAFDYYQRGNDIMQRLSRFDADENTRETARIKASCSAERFSARAGYGVTARDPIFIVGLPRSGSTLLEQILASHPLVDGTMELPHILQFARRLAARSSPEEDPRYPDALWSLTESECRALGEEYLDATRIQRQDAPFFVDKMPNNFRHVGLIHLILPNATIIDARRDPYATCFSAFKQLFAAGQEFTYGLDNIGRYYRDYAELMGHWDMVLPGRVLRVQYEDVISDIDTQVRRVLDHCGLAFDAACLDFHTNERAVRTASSEQVRQPLYASAVQHWRHFEEQLAPLTAYLD
ncbi:MAG: sulfotransferase [Pseudomonadota bacterium]